MVDRLDEIEIRVLTTPTQQLLLELVHLKRRVISLRKTLILMREVLARLTRGEFDLVDIREIAYYRNVFDHLVRYTELIEGAREMASDLMQTHLAAASNKLNGIMKVLAMVSTIILPMSLIASIYGMNFEELPETKWTYGYRSPLAHAAGRNCSDLGVQTTEVVRTVIRNASIGRTLGIGSARSTTQVTLELLSPTT